MSLSKNEIMRAKLIVTPDLGEAKAALDQEHTCDTWYNYGMALVNAGKSEEAINAYSQGLVENPFAPILYFGRGAALSAPSCMTAPSRILPWPSGLTRRFIPTGITARLPTTWLATTRRLFRIFAAPWSRPSPSSATV